MNIVEPLDNSNQWWRARTAAGFNDRMDVMLMLAPCPDGHFAVPRLEADEATAWLREVLSSSALCFV